jgi:hypothetical protein
VEFAGSRDATDRENCAKATAEADLVILSTRRKYQLPPKVKEWMEKWPSLIIDSNPAVAALVENDESDCGATACTLLCLGS